MKRFQNILFLFSLSLALYSQTSIKGQVVDKDNKQPVADVIVQYGATSKDYVLTDQNGTFTIPDIADDTIYFQCIGYKSLSLKRSVLSQHALVELELNPFSLSPIVISPIAADKLLNEAMLNTKKNLLTGQQLGYRLRFLQTYDKSHEKNEIYLKYITKLSEKDLKKALKKEKIPYTINLVDIVRTQRSEFPISDLYGAEYHASHLFTFGKSENNETTLSHTADSTRVILNIEPLPGKGSWARGRIEIDRKDMAVVSMEIESVDSVLEKQSYSKYLEKKYKIISKRGRFEFRKWNGKYFMTDCFSLYRFRNINEDGNEEEIEYQCDIVPLGFINKHIVKKRPLSGYCQELFYIPDTTLDEFWYEPIDPDLNLPDVAVQPLLHPSGKTKGVLKAVLFAVGVAGIVLLVK